MWLILIALTIGLISLLFIKRQWRLWILASQLPGPPSFPIIGCPSLSNNNGDILLNLIEMRKKYSSPMKLWITIDLNVVVDRPEDVKAVLTSNKCLDRMDFYKFMKSFSGIGLITLDTPAWQFHRKLLNSSFNSISIQAFIPIFDAKSKLLVESLKGETGAVDLQPFINNCVMEFICETSTGVEMNFQKHQNLGYIQAMKSMFKIIMKRTSSPWLHPEFIYKKSGLFQEQTNHLKVTDGLINGVFNSKKENGPPVKSRFLIDQLMSFYKNGTLTEEEVVGEIKTVITAGSDTTSNGAAYTILLLAMHPDIQDNVYDEINKAFPDESMELTLATINELKFLDMVIKESLRILPIVPFIGRKVSGDFQMGHLNIPAGATIGICTYTLHRSVEIWGEQANKFNPDNFLPENIEKRHPYSFIPFVSGARNCIGDKYAMLSMKILIINLLRTFSFSTDMKFDELQTEMHVTLKIINNFQVSVKFRN